MLSLILWLCPSIQTPAAAPPAATQQLSAWDALADEYQRAFEAWATELSRTGAFDKPESERPPEPARGFWARFEALADGGEGRAVLWMQDHWGSSGGEALATRRSLFERVRKAGDAEWVASALPRLGTQGIETDVLAVVRGLQADSKPKPLRVAAQLAEARLVHESDPALAADLRVRAAFLQFQDVELAAGEALAPEDLGEMVGALVKGVEKAQRAHFEEAYYPGADGIYFPRCAAPPDPEETWKPVVETLADKGSSPAQLWALTNADWQLDEAQKERLRGYLDALCQGPMSAETIATLGQQTESLVYRLGLEFVEPRARALIEKCDEAERAGMLCGLARSLCEVGANDPAACERGLAILREVQERWPKSSDAKTAAGLIFRFTNLVIGKTAPDFETADVDGNAFKLSDYKGKVTVVDFWGFW